MLDFLTLETHPEPDASVIWLHGLGADGHDFESIVPELGLPPEFRIRFIFPNAPVRPIGINGNFPMRGWYDIRYADLSKEPDIQGIRESARLTAELIREQEKKGISSARIVLAGFSQGGAIALELGLRYPQKLGGIIALSTFSPTANTLKQEASEANRSIPLFWGHGTFDPVVPLALAETTEKELSAQGYSVKFCRYAGMPHSVCMEEIQDISGFLQKVLA